MIPDRPRSVGFDYAMAIHRLRQRWGTTQLMWYLGYSSRRSLDYMQAGRSIPNHQVGELIYILYFETFGAKPPQSIAQIRFRRVLESTSTGLLTAT